MMKRMTGLALCALLGGCVVAVGSTEATAPGAVDSKRFEVAGFDAVDLSGSDDVRILRSDTPSVVASGDPRAVAALSVTVAGGTLHVARKPGRWSDRGAVVTVTLPSLRAATIAGSGDMEVETAAPGFTGRVAGSGTMTLRDIAGEAVRIELAGSGDVVASGTVGRLDIALNGSGDVDARRLAARDLHVDLAGSGNVHAQASQTADIAARGSGDVTVSGPARCAVRKGGSGDVRCG